MAVEFGAEEGRYGSNPSGRRGGLLMWLALSVPVFLAGSSDRGAKEPDPPSLMRPLPVAKGCQIVDTWFERCISIYRSVDGATSYRGIARRCVATEAVAPNAKCGTICSISDQPGEPCGRVD